MPSDPLEHVRALDRFAPLLADAADRLEADPEAWATLWQVPELRAIACLGLPEAITPAPFEAAGLGHACPPELHLAIIERLSRGAASALMSLPSSALPTRAVLTLGTEGQIADFFAPFRNGPAWTFFAVTEPKSGSDAGAAMATLANGKLSGQKILIGGAAQARRGLVLARDEASAGRPVLVIVDRDMAGDTMRVTPLEQTGLAGAGLCRIEFDSVAVTDDAILARNSRIPAMMALAAVFERHRPMVGAMSLGTARAILDLTAAATERPCRSLLLQHAHLCREMTALGRAFGEGRTDIHAISQFKRQATALASNAVAESLAAAPGLVVESARLRRLIRDAGAFEYMEGTSNIHRLNGYRAYLAGRSIDEHAS